jgi:hypothetical protein
MSDEISRLILSTRLLLQRSGTDLKTFAAPQRDVFFYKAGPTRKVQGRKKYMVYEEEDWVDEEETGHRGPDD